MPMQELIEIAEKYAAAEAAGDLEATLNTFESEPVFELYPIGLRLTGAENVRCFYRHFFAHIAPRMVRDRERSHGEWRGKTGLVKEYQIAYRYAEASEPHDRAWMFRVLKVITFGDRALRGAHIYADENLLKIMFAPVWDDLEIIEG